MEDPTRQSGSPEARSDRLGAGDGIETPADAFHDAVEKLTELRAYVSYYVAAKADQAKVTARNTAMYGVMGVVGLIAILTAVALGVALMCLGLAFGLSAAFGHTWLGYVVAGLVILALIGAASFAGYTFITRSSRKQMVEKYEHLQQQQRLEFGQDVCQRAAEAD